VDVRRLPSPGRERPELDAAYVAARTPIERLLTDAWAEVLGVAPVGVADDFFDLGGDSLKAGQVVSRLRASVPFDVPLRLVFEEPTVARLARAILSRTAPDEPAPPTAG